MFKEFGQVASLMWQMKSLAPQMAGKMQEMRQRMATHRTVGRSSDGLVTIELNGEGQVLACQIHAEQFPSATRGTLERATAEAMNLASQQLKEWAATEMSSMTQGIDPGLLGSLLGGKPG